MRLIIRVTLSAAERKELMFTVKWLKGLAAAAVSGLANGGGMILVDPVAFSGNWEALGKAALVGSVIGVIAYIKKSPNQ